MNADQTRLFYDDVQDALRTTVQALGGMKVVGARLWPEKAPDAAGRHLADCLNTAKAEKLSPEQVLTLARWGHEVGCHAYAAFLGAEVGYDVRVTTPAEQRDQLAESIRAATSTLDRALKLAERLEGRS